MRWLRRLGRQTPGDLFIYAQLAVVAAITILGLASCAKVAWFK